MRLLNHSKDPFTTVYHARDEPWHREPFKKISMPVRKRNRGGPAVMITFKPDDPGAT